MKRLAGKRWFYAMGQRSAYPGYTGPTPDDSYPEQIWPTWARHQFETGYAEGNWERARQTVKGWPTAKLAESIKGNQS